MNRYEQGVPSFSAESHFCNVITEENKSAKESPIITVSLMVIGGTLTYILWLQHFTPFHFLNYFTKLL